MKKTRFPFVLRAVFVMLLAFAGTALAAPVPPLESDRDAVWEAAWETAWEIAWETPSDLTVEFSGDVQGEAPMEFVVDFQQNDEVGTPLELSWGAPDQSGAAVQGVSPELVASFGLPWSEERAFHHELRLGRLYVETTPADAVIRLLNADKQFSQGMDLSAGQYVIEVVKEGYEPQVRRVEVLAGMAATVRMDLLLVADAGGSLPGAAGYLPPDPSTSTPEQLAKGLATPDASLAAMPTASQPASSSADHPTPAANLGSLHLAAADHARSDASHAEGSTENARPEVSEAAAGSGSLRVNVSPADARVRVLDIKPRFEQGIALEPGTYTIDAKLYGYATVTRDVVIEPDRETVVDLALEELPTGRLYVKSKPENAYVRILDIRPRFEQGMELAAGEYTVDATISGYGTVEKKVRVQGGQDTVVEVELQQVEPTGRLYVDTLPADATIRVLGILPTFHQGMELAAGVYTIDATQDEGERVEMRVEIAAGQDNRYTLALDDTGSNGRLFVQTEPAGATVRVLNIKPKFAQGMGLEPGTYTIDVAQPGFETKVQKISVLPGRETRVDVALSSAVAVAETEPLAAQPEAGWTKAEQVGGLAISEEPLLPTGMAAGEVVEAATVLPEAETVEPVVAQEAQESAVEKEKVLHVEASENSIQAFDIEVFLSMAQLALNAGDYVGALDAARQVLALDPNNVPAYKVRSEAYMALGQYSDAIQTLDSALARTPGNQELRLAKDEAEQRLRRRDESEKQGSSSISLDPGYYGVYEN